jgi:hypothetical protein
MTVRFNCGRADFKAIVRIRRQRIARHAKKLRVHGHLAWDAVPCDPTQVFPDLVQYVPYDAQFLGEMIHGVGEPLQLL